MGWRELRARGHLALGGDVLTMTLTMDYTHTITSTKFLPTITIRSYNFDRGKLMAWLESFAPKAYVGRPDYALGCPMYNFLHSFDEDILEVRIWDVESAKLGELTLPHWASRWIDKMIDHSINTHAQHITAKKALELLAQIT